LIANDRNVPLKLGLNENAGYVDPVNFSIMKESYLYFGFLSTDLARNNDVQGITVGHHTLLLLLLLVAVMD